MVFLTIFKILAGINEVTLYWLNFFLTEDSFNKIPKGEMLKNMTFFILLFSPIV